MVWLLQFGPLCSGKLFQTIPIWVGPAVYRIISTCYELLRLNTIYLYMIVIVLGSYICTRKMTAHLPFQFEVHLSYPSCKLDDYTHCKHEVFLQAYSHVAWGDPASTGYSATDCTLVICSGEKWRWSVGKALEFTLLVGYLTYKLSTNSPWRVIFEQEWTAEMDSRIKSSVNSNWGRGTKGQLKENLNFTVPLWQSVTCTPGVLHPIRRSRVFPDLKLYWRSSSNAHTVLDS